MTNPPTAAPGVAVEATIQRLMSLAADWKRLPGMTGESVDAQDALREALRTALLAGAAGGGDPVGVLCISHHLDSPAMENIEYQPMRTLPPGNHLLFLSAENPKSQAISMTCEIEPIYLIRPLGPRHEHDSNWSEATKEAYDLTPEKWRRKLYAHPPVPVRAPQVTDSEVDAYCDAWATSFKEANPFHTVSCDSSDRAHIKAGLEAFAASRVVTGALPASHEHISQFLPSEEREAWKKFTTAMADKLHKKYLEGYSGFDSCTEEQLCKLLYAHLEKGDPVDMANFCMFLSDNGQRIVPPLAATPPSAAPAEPIPPVYLADGVTGNPEWLAYKHGVLNPAIEAGGAAPAEPTGEIPAPLAVCPITGRKFWGNLHHPELGTVATYGGPLDTYTLPQIGEDGELRSERYDQDAGRWVEGGEPMGWFYADQQGSGEVQVDAARAASTGDFELVKSIIHKCPALKLPRSFLEKLGGIGQIVPLVGVTQEVADFILEKLNAPAVGWRAEDNPHDWRTAANARTKWEQDRQRAIAANKAGVSGGA